MRLEILPRIYDRHPEHQLEYDLTWRILDRYLPAGGRILEGGAATGAYTLPLVKKGYRLTAVDLSYRQSFFCQQQLHDAGFRESAQLLLSDVRYLGLEKGGVL